MEKNLVISMAKSKRDAKDKIEDLALTFATHLTYLLFFDSKENEKHWRKELSSYSYIIWGLTKLRGAKGFTKLSLEDLMDFLYETIWLGDREETLLDLYRISTSYNKRLKPHISNVDLIVQNRIG